MATTTERGLGWAHQQAAAQLHRDHVDGTPCARCGRPMYRWQKLDAGHSRDRALVGPGEPPDRLEHARCNRVAGARLGNRLRRSRQARPVRRVHVRGVVAVDARAL